MRKLKLQSQITINGFISGTNGEMDFVEWNWDDGLKKYVEKLTESVDTILLGRTLAEGFIPYWTSVAANPDAPEHLAGKKFTDTPKVVFTKTLDKSEWNNTTLAKGNIIEEVNKIKRSKGNDIIAYGGASFVSSLIKNNLIDEYHLFVNPSAIGTGKPIFNGIQATKCFKLVKTIPFECGIVLLNYEPK